MISRPINEVSPPIECNWVACHNPVIFEYQRQDYEVLQITDNGGNTLLRFVSPLIASDFAVGNKLTILSQLFSTSLTLIGSYEILSVSTVTIGLTTFYNVTIDLPFTGASYSFANADSRRLWYLEFTVGTRVLRLTPNAAGRINVDLSRALQTLVNLKDETSYLFDPAIPGNAANRRDENASNDVEYTLQEKWRGASGTLSEPFPLVIVSGAFQVGSTNDCFYVNHTIYDVPLSNTKFLTRFKQPSYWRGLPFDVQINVDETCNGPLRFQYAYYDFQGNLLTNNNRSLNILRFGVLQRIVVDWNNYEGNFFEYWIRDFTDNNKVRVKIKTACDGYYLRWRNTLGGVDYWNFDSYKNETMTTQGVGIFAPYFETIEDARSTGEFTSKRASDTLNLQASALTVDEMEGLMDLLSSPSVQIYEDEIWKTILIQPGTFNRYESGNLSKVEFQAIKVDKQIQSW
jgi:hypothetical protein